MIDRPRSWPPPPSIPPSPDSPARAHLRPIPQPIPGTVGPAPFFGRSALPCIPPPPSLGAYREPGGESLETRVERIEKVIADARRNAWRTYVAFGGIVFTLSFLGHLLSGWAR